MHAISRRQTISTTLMTTTSHTQCLVLNNRNSSWPFGKYRINVCTCVVWILFGHCLFELAHYYLWFVCALYTIKFITKTKRSCGHLSDAYCIAIIAAIKQSNKSTTPLTPLTHIMRITHNWNQTEAQTTERNGKTNTLKKNHQSNHIIYCWCGCRCINNSFIQFDHFSQWDACLEFTDPPTKSRPSFSIVICENCFCSAKNGQFIDYKIYWRIDHNKWLDKWYNNVKSSKMDVNNQNSDVSAIKIWKKKNSWLSLCFRSLSISHYNVVDVLLILHGKWTLCPFFKYFLCQLPFQSNDAAFQSPTAPIIAEFSHSLKPCILLQHVDDHLKLHVCKKPGAFFNWSATHEHMKFARAKKKPQQHQRKKNECLANISKMRFISLWLCFTWLETQVRTRVNSIHIHRHYHFFFRFSSLKYLL